MYFFVLCHCTAFPTIHNVWLQSIAAFPNTLRFANTLLISIPRQAWAPQGLMIQVRINRKQLHVYLCTNWVTCYMIYIVYNMLTSVHCSLSSHRPSPVSLSVRKLAQKSGFSQFPWDTKYGRRTPSLRMAGLFFQHRDLDNRQELWCYFCFIERVQDYLLQKIFSSRMGA